MKMINETITALFCILVLNIATSAGFLFGSWHTHGGLGNIDLDTTNACVDDFKSSKGDCSVFRKCCQNICGTSGSGFQASCTVNNDKARLACKCSGGGSAGGGTGTGTGTGSSIDDQGAPVYEWQTQRPKSTSKPVTATFATARPGAAKQSCGVPKVQPTARIVGGTEAKPNSWPWQISLQLRGRHLCGGSLIDPTHILTAAHCFKLSSSPSGYTVVVGMHDKAAIDGTSIPLAKIIKHPNYDETANSNDAAIGVLAKPVTFSDKIIPICLPQADVPEGTICEATGWGDTGGTGNNQYLNQVRVPIISRAVCNDRQHYAGMIDSTMICAGASGKDSCQGDSGGPLVCQRSDGVWELQGVTSWGAECAQVNKPGVYCRVIGIKAWVNQVTKS